MMELLRLPEREAREVVARMDNSRAKLLKTYFSRDIRDPLLYDVTWNTDSVAIEEIASSTIALIQSKLVTGYAFPNFNVEQKDSKLGKRSPINVG
jgi:Cytidylate kinase-like family